MLGQKQIYLIPYELNLKKQSWNQIDNIIYSSLDSDLQNIYKSSYPILINNYTREYYQSANRTIRITLDRDIKTLDQRFGPFPNLSRFMPTRNIAILEIKADGCYHEEVAEVLSEFPAYCSAYSKYIQGLENMSF